MKKLVLLSYFVFHLFIGYSQQEQQYSQYMINPFSLNPAIAGTEDFIDVSAGFRSQWTQFDGSPVTYYLATHGTLGKQFNQYHHKGEHTAWHGVGTQVYRDHTGPLRRTSFLVAYAYNLPINRTTRLSIGSYFGVKQLETNRDYWKNIDDMSDQLFSIDLTSGYQPDFHFGAALYSKYYYVNFSAFQLLGSKLDFNGFHEVSNQSFDQGELKRHYFLNGGLRLPVNESMRISPSMMAKYQIGAPLSVDMNVKITQYDKVWYGASFRVMESVNVFAGMEIHHQFDVSYAFEWSLSRIRSYNIGTHEIIVRMRFKHPKHLVCPSNYW